MNRHQRRASAAKRRKFKEGTVIYTKTITVVLTTGERQLFWFEEPYGFSPAEAERLLSWIRGECVDAPHLVLHGPFKTDSEVDESQRLTLFGPQCEVRDGGVLHPAPEELQ